MGTRVLLADDHPVVRQGLKSLLTREGFFVVAEAADGREAAQLIESTHPDVALLDVGMPGLNGLDAAREILQRFPTTKVIILTQHAEEPYVLEALRAGVHGYVLKSQSVSDLVQAIRDVTRGRIYVSPAISDVVVSAYRGQSKLPADSLTTREREVLQLVAEGKSTRKIAEILGIAQKTAESHRSHLMVKLGIHEVAGLVRYAVKRGLVQA